MEMMKYTEEIRIYNHYTNYKGRLFIKTLCDLFNDVAETQTERLGVDVGTLNRMGQTWMLHRLHVLIRKMPHKEETVVLETWPSGIDRLFALRDYRMLRKDGEELVRATSQWMTVDLNRRRPVRPSLRIVEMSTSHTIPPLLLPPLFDGREVAADLPDSREFIATFDNIDFNGHVTQASYIRWITNSLPFEFLKNHILTEAEIVYEHEIMPDSRIVSAYRIEPQTAGPVVYHRIMDETGCRVHCVACTLWKKHSDNRAVQ